MVDKIVMELSENELELLEAFPEIDAHVIEVACRTPGCPQNGVIHRVTAFDSGTGIHATCGRCGRRHTAVEVRPWEDIALRGI